MGILVILSSLGRQKTNPIKANFGVSKMHHKSKSNKSDQIACLNRHPVRVLSVPFDVAADGIRQGNGHGIAGQMFFERSFKVVDRYFARIARIIHAPASVNEPAVLAEYKRNRKSTLLQRILFNVDIKKYHISSFYWTLPVKTIQNSI